MRLWLIISALLICNALNPKYELPTYTGVLIVILGIAGGIFDYIELRK